ncbi:helix-turn-helix domain-containing protein [Desulfuromonas acetexigens]|uniref:Helix-turn-helix domain-containing protein n=2 Tax=Trichloromonas acetexigens TaxID=38815 RepID=A0A550J5W0_9BACT|nr:helix-turn-helix domain-containing protein [Desulfuromonas acetexigens]
MPNMKATFKTIIIKSQEQMLNECAETMNAVMRGEPVAPQEPEYSFTSFEAFRRAMTPQRFALLRLIREKRPDSIKELAALAGRDMKNVSEDVKILLEMDLLELEKRGKTKAPRLHYDGFRLEVAV